MKRARQSSYACAALLLLLGCGGEDVAEDQPAEETPATRAPGPEFPPPGGTAGTWRIMPRRAAGDTLPSFELFATADTLGWKMKFADRDTLPVRVTPTGDSLRLEIGPYESVLRPGVQVTSTLWTLVLGDTLVGRLQARYTSAGPDSILDATVQGVRAPPP